MISEHELELPADASAPGLARRYLREFAARLPAAMLEDAVVLVSEVVTNAVRHGRPGIGFQLLVADSPQALRVRITDRGDNFSTLVRPAGLDAVGGRGLLVLDALASSWGMVENDPPPGKMVWFELKDRVLTR